MRYILKYSFILTLLLFLQTCKKYGHGYIEGRILDRSTNQPIQGVKLVFEHWKPCGSCSYLWDTVGMTDANGYFKYYLHKKISKEYKMWFFHSNYFESSEGLIYKKTKEDVTLEPHSFFEMHIKKTSTSTNFIIWSTEECSDKFIHNNSTIDTIIKIPCFIRGGATKRLSWAVYDNSSSFLGQYFIDTLLNRGQTLTLDVVFN